LIFLAIPTFDAWARCAVPKASLTKTSPSDAQYAPSSGLFFDSYLTTSPLTTSSKRVFSNNKISPGFKALIAVKQK
jgi:hypothetical protein